MTTGTLSDVAILIHRQTQMSVQVVSEQVHIAPPQFFWDEVIRMPTALSAARSISSFATLDENWNSYGASAIPMPVVRKALRILDRAKGAAQAASARWITPEVAPTPDGRVFIDWAGENLRLTLVIGDTQIREVLKVGSEKAVARWVNEDEAVAAITSAIG